MKTQRTHDKLYLKEERYENTKEMFKFIVANSFKKDELNCKINICDFGCANGEFLFYLNKLSKASLYGLDILSELLIKAKKFVPQANFVNGSVTKKNIFNSNKFDKSFLTGVHSIFDEFETPFNNLIYWTKPGGNIIITGIFNSYPIDVYVKYKESKNYQSEYYEKGWNIFSIKSISNFLNKVKKVKSYSFKKFEIGIDLEKQSDPVRSWTIKEKNNKRIITNGLSILQQHYTLIIDL
tara:strand:+ start:1184 stop:1897 length:714 start_codon:yes stop_codon:yes gene_type:complete